MVCVCAPGGRTDEFELGLKGGENPTRCGSKAKKSKTKGSQRQHCVNRPPSKQSNPDRLDYMQQRMEMCQQKLITETSQIIKNVTKHQCQRGKGEGINSEEIKMFAFDTISKWQIILSQIWIIHMYQPQFSEHYKQLIKLKK